MEYVDNLGDSNVNATIGTSPNGSVWAMTDVGAAWESICWSPRLGLFCAVAGGGQIFTSSDGMNWTSQSIDRSSPFMLTSPPTAIHHKTIYEAETYPWNDFYVGAGKLYRQFGSFNLDYDPNAQSLPYPVWNLPITQAAPAPLDPAKFVAGPCTQGFTVKHSMQIQSATFYLSGNGEIGTATVTIMDENSNILGTAGASFGVDWSSVTFNFSPSISVYNETGISYSFTIAGVPEIATYPSHGASKGVIYSISGLSLLDIEHQKQTAAFDKLNYKPISPALCQAFISQYSGYLQSVQTYLYINRVQIVTDAPSGPNVFTLTNLSPGFVKCQNTLPLSILLPPASSCANFSFIIKKLHNEVSVVASVGDTILGSGTSIGIGDYPPYITLKSMGSHWILSDLHITVTLKTTTKRWDPDTTLGSTKVNLAALNLSGFDTVTETSALVGVTFDPILKVIAGSVYAFSIEIEPSPNISVQSVGFNDSGSWAGLFSYANNSWSVAPPLTFRLMYSLGCHPTTEPTGYVMESGMSSATIAEGVVHAMTAKGSSTLYLYYLISGGVQAYVTRSTSFDTADRQKQGTVFFICDSTYIRGTLTTTELLHPGTVGGGIAENVFIVDNIY